MEYTEYTLKGFLAEMMEKDLRWSFSVEMAHAMMDWVNQKYPPSVRGGPNPNIWHYSRNKLEKLPVRLANGFDDDSYSYYVRIENGGPLIFLAEKSEHSMMHEFAHHLDDVFCLDSTSSKERRELNRAFAILKKNKESMPLIDLVKGLIVQFTSSREFITRELIYKFLMDMGWDRDEAVYMSQIDMDPQKASRVFRLWDIEPDDGKLSWIIGAWNRQLVSRDLKELIKFEYN